MVLKRPAQSLRQAGRGWCQMSIWSQMWCQNELPVGHYNERLARGNAGKSQGTRALGSWLRDVGDFKSLTKSAIRQCFDHSACWSLAAAPAVSERVGPSAPGPDS
ncbi:hypothetical protein GGTG_04173 [Gaeumannomyces tritici R3-111a-1]|uniref:Uncharacterized protein n=1 Tax=Gaeumannomyces tritici (strain R3-111a-1) TaxID=644352 RepID=J3NSC7_GAET3|nr:hypothetical protein GGTG_04173 [Gaeumannomyces tritici R3-111a-1]EJT79084.1 hypothetical protein GGTG_04173 [Gaeumannomyces tritici R3-111a-1]